MKPKPKILSIAVPGPLAEWVDLEASAHGMNRNQFVNHTLQMAREFQTVERVERLERRVSVMEAQVL